MSRFNYKNIRPEFIVCAAIWVNDGQKHSGQFDSLESGYLLCGVGHADCVSISALLNPHHSARDMRNSGFVTNHRRFVGREEAAQIAYDAGQIKEKVETLYSEDLVYEK